MSVEIKEISDTEFTVNGKPVYKDSNGNWVSKHLNTNEARRASNHIIILNGR